MNALSEDDVLPMLPRLRRYARVLTGDEAQGDDLVVRAIRYAREQARAPTLTGMMAIAHALQRDARPHPARTMLLRLERSLSLRACHPMMKRLASLPLDERAALALVAVEGFTYADVAEVLDVPVATAMETLARARARLRADAPRESRRLP
jgi:RNA polymerase sigma-70 factor (ECF subfamily)